MNPSLDYLYQYPVKQVLTKQDEDGYAIEFGGGPENSGTGAIIGIENATEFPELADKALLTTVFSGTETRMIFGNVDQATREIVDRVEVVVAPTDYFIIDPRFGGEAFYPGKPVVEEDRPLTVSGQFQDGPDAPQTATAPKAEYFDPEQDHGA